LAGRVSGGGPRPRHRDRAERHDHVAPRPGARAGQEQLQRDPPGGGPPRDHALHVFRRSGGLRALQHARVPTARPPLVPARPVQGGHAAEPPGDGSRGGLVTRLTPPRDTRPRGRRMWLRLEPTARETLQAAALALAAGAAVASSTFYLV